MSVTLIDPYRFATFDSDYELISTTLISSDTASVTFSDLGDYSSTYKHLQLRVVGRSSRASFDNDPMLIRFNGDTGSNYNFHSLSRPGGGGVVSNADPWIGTLTAAGAATSTNFAANVFDILDAFSSSKNTTIRCFCGATEANTVLLQSGLWRNTASLTSIQLLTFTSNNFIAGSRFSLYGIRG